MGKLQVRYQKLCAMGTALVFWFALNAFSVAKGATTAALWQGDKKGVVSITFHDGLPSQFNNAFPILQQHGLKATFYIISSEADTAAIQAVVANGQEIGSETVTAPDLTALSYSQQVNELSQSQLYLQQLTGQKVDTLAYPDGAYNTSVINLTKNYYIAARSADSWALNSSSPDPNQFYKLVVVAPHDNGSGDASAIAYLQYQANEAALEGEWAIELFESIGISGGYDTVSSQALSTHMDYLVQNEPNLWVAPVGTVSEYIYERNAASITTLASDSNLIQLNLHCGLDSRFNTPLTLLTDCPAGWELGTVYAIQGLTATSANVVSKNGKLYIKYNAVPDAGTIELSMTPAPPVYYAITASSDSNGTIAPSGTITKTQNSDQLFTATPQPGYQVDEWFVDGVAVQTGGITYDLIFICANHTVNVTFKPYSATVALWQGDKKGAVSITLDDGLECQISNAYPVLAQNGLKATFFIISSYVIQPLSQMYMDVNDLLTLVSGGHEIGSHTVTHPYLTTISHDQQVYELSQSQSALQQLTGQKVDTINYPYGDYDTDVMNIAGNYYIAARSSDSGILNSSSPTSNEFYRLYAGGPHDHYGPGDANAIAGLKYWTDQAVTEQKWYIEIFHGIDTGYDEVSSQAFNTHLSYLVANEPNLWVAPMGMVSEYIYERNAASITTLVSDSNIIKLNLHCGLDSRFNTPLTLLTDCPPAWASGSINVKQGLTVASANIVSKNGNLYMKYNTVPDAGTIELSPSPVTITASSGVNGTVNPSGTTAENYGASQLFTAVPATGYQVDTWSIDGSTVQTGGLTYTLSNIITTHTISVTFKLLTYTIITSTGSNGTISPTNPTVNYGENQQFTATPNTGYEVDKWLVDGSDVQSGGTSYTLNNITATHTVSVMFKLLTYTVTTSAGISPVNPTVNYGDNELFTATPSTGYQVDTWSVDGSVVQTGGTTYTLSNITATHAVSVTFKILTYQITASAGTNGLISPPGTVTKNYGDNQLFTAAPSTGYQVDTWSVDGSVVQTGGLTYTLSNITATHTVSVTFKFLTYAITTSIGSNGTISPTNPTVNYGSNQVFTATPSTGYLVDTWSLDGTGVQTGGTTYTLSNITTTHTVAVSFKILAYQVMASAGTHGAIAPSGQVTKDYGTSQLFTATPDTNYEVDKWSVDGNDVQTGGITYTLSNIIAIHTVSVTFKLSVLTISGYIIEPDGNTPVVGATVDANNNGGSITVTDVNGHYKVLVPYNWYGKATPVKEGYIFEPNSILYNNIISNEVSGYTARLSTFVISGRILKSGNAPVADVNVAAENGGGQWTTKYGGGSGITDANGYYKVLVDYKWSGRVTPAKYAYAFDPNSKSYADIVADQNDQNYAATLMTFAISGYVLNDCNVPIKSVTVSADNGGSTVTTDPNGRYEVWVSYNWSGAVTVSKAHYAFTPVNMAYADILSNQGNQRYQGINIYDLDCDGSISYGDIAVISENWLSDTPGNICDFNADSIVNFKDFADFANIWTTEFGQ